MLNLVRVVALGAMIAAEDARACGCVRASFEDGLNESEYVFLGTVKSASIDGYSEQAGRTVVVVDAIYLMKGDPQKVPTTLTTPNWSGHCGKEIVVPGRYWFFTDGNGNFDGCSATVEMIDPSVAKYFDEGMKELMKFQRAQVERIIKEEQVDR